PSPAPVAAVPSASLSGPPPAAAAVPSASLSGAAPAVPLSGPPPAAAAGPSAPLPRSQTATDAMPVEVNPAGCAVVGGQYATAADFTDAVVEEAVATGRCLVRRRKEKGRVRFECSGTTSTGGACAFKCTAMLHADTETYHVSRADAHSCVFTTGSGDEKANELGRLHSEWVTRRIAAHVEAEPDLSVKGIVASMRTNGVTITSKVARLAKAQALQETGLDAASGFRKLRAYFAAVKCVDAEAVTSIDTKPGVATEEDANPWDVFGFAFLAFGACVHAARSAMFVSVDGTHLTHGGVLFVAVVLDPMQKVVPIAYALGQTEDTASWTSFLVQLKELLPEGFTLMSDRDKGLMSAVKTVLPTTLHLICVNHVVRNVSKSFGKGTQHHVWKLAHASSHESYAKILAIVSKENDDLACYLDKLRDCMSDAYLPYQSRALTWVQTTGTELVLVPGDGDCFYSCLANVPNSQNMFFSAHNGDGRGSRTLRTILFQEVQNLEPETRALFKQRIQNGPDVQLRRGESKFDAWVRVQSAHRAWASTEAVLLAAIVFKVKIVLISVLQVPEAEQPRLTMFTHHPVEEPVSTVYLIHEDDLSGASDHFSLVRGKPSRQLLRNPNNTTNSTKNKSKNLNKTSTSTTYTKANRNRKNNRNSTSHTTNKTINSHHKDESNFNNCNKNKTNRYNTNRSNRHQNSINKSGTNSSSTNTSTNSNDPDISNPEGSKHSHSSFSSNCNRTNSSSSNNSSRRPRQLCLDNLRANFTSLVDGETENVIAGVSKIVRMLSEERARLVEEKEAFLREKRSFEAMQQRIQQVNRMSQSKITINVGGTRFETTLDTLRAEEGSMLDAMFSGKYTLDTEGDTGICFIDRDDSYFPLILSYLRARRDGTPGRKYTLDNATAAHLMREANFYGLTGLERSLAASTALVVSQTGASRYFRVQDALRDAREGDRILVQPGVYFEYLYIDKNVEIIGDVNPALSLPSEYGRASSSSDGSCSCASLRRKRSPGAAPCARPSDAICDFCQSGSNTGAPKNNQVILTYAGEHVITSSGEAPCLKNIVINQQGDEYHCIFITSGCLNVDSCTLTSSGWACVGISGENTHPFLTNNNIASSTDNGIIILARGKGIIEHNNIQGFTLQGIEIREGSNPVIRHNRIHHGDDSGIYINTKGKGVIENNHIYANAFNGIAVKFEIENSNDIHGNASGNMVEEYTFKND
ncbi:F-box protein dre-1, partial [Diplonema papillatum]